MAVDGLALNKLQIGQNDPKEEQVNMTGSFIPPPTTKALEEKAEKTDDDELTKVKKRDQQEKEKSVVYQRMYIGQLS